MKNPLTLSTLTLLSLILLSLTPSALAQSSSEITAQHNYTLELKGEDAEALYIRLERKENRNDGIDRVTTKVGQSLLCTEEKQGLLKKGEYVCALSFKVGNGELHEMYPIGETDTKAGLKNPKEYQGQLIEIKKDSTDALIRVVGSNAAIIYRGMTGEAKLAALVDGKFQTVEESELPTREPNGTLARVKTGKQVQCFQSIETLSPTTNCILMIETKTGKPKKAEEPGSSGATPDAAPSPTEK
jgi:hypothetical protein